MTRLLIIIFCSMLIIASLISLSVHDAEIAYIIGLSRFWIIGRLALEFFLLAYYLFYPLRQRGVALGMRAAGIGLIYMGLSSLLWGSRASGTFVPITDIVLALEGGIVAVLASIELPLSDRAALDLTSLKLTAVNAMRSPRKSKLGTAQQ